MELRMKPLLQSHRWVAREPDWTVAAIAGFGAGGILMLLELAFAVAMGADPWRAPRLIAAMLLGDGVLQGAGYNLPVLVAALVVHYLLGIFFGCVLAALVAPFHLDSSLALVLAVGALFGVGLYLFNFYVIAGVLTWFEELRGWTTLLGHMVFGIVAAGIYRQLERPTG